MTFPHIGLVGCGRWGRFILRDLRVLGCTVAVVARSPVSRGFALQFGAKTIVREIAQLPNCDGYIVAVPTKNHAEVIDALIPRNAPIYCEKPLTADPTRAWRLAERGGSRLFVMDKWRHHPGIEALRTIAMRRELGAVQGLRLVHIGWGCHPSDADAIWALAPHCLAIALEVLGEIPKPHWSHVEMLGEVPVGMLGCLGTQPWATLEVSARSPSKRREFRLHCQEGVAAFDEANPASVTVIRETDPWRTELSLAEVRPIAQEPALVRQLRAFVGHLKGGPAPRSSGPEGAAIVQVIHELRALAGLVPVAATRAA